MTVMTSGHGAARRSFVPGLRAAGRAALAGAFVAMQATGPALAAPAAEKTARKPNIIVILADDLGYSDIGAFGGEIHTPNLDRLAQEGTRFTSFYASPFCSPTRSMLLTGQDNHRAGLGDMAELMIPEEKGHPGYEGHLNDRVIAFPQLLHDAGYHTYMVGKWHLGTQEEFSPATRGFEKSFVLTQGAASHFGQLRVISKDGKTTGKALYREDGKAVDLPDNFYSTIGYTDKMIDYLGSNIKDGKPFFAYVAYTSPHWPLQAPDADIARYDGTYDGGYDAIRQARFARMKAAGLVPEDSALFTGNPRWPAWSTLSPAEQKSESKRMAVYAAMVDVMDQQIGRLISYLKAEGQLDNTVIFFMSDNGADGNSVLDIEGTRQWVHSTADNSIANTGRPGSFVEYGPGWAQVSMTPLRMYKAFNFEGGITVPAMVWGPTLGVGTGTRRDVLRVQDISATALDLAGVSYPADGIYQGHPVLPIQGRSFLSYVRGTSGPVHGPEEGLGFELGGRKALRKGDWKIVYANAPWGTGDWELYNIAEDRTEQHNLARERPEKLAEMLVAWTQYVKDNGVLELPNLAVRPGYSNGTDYYQDEDADTARAGGK